MSNEEMMEKTLTEEQLDDVAGGTLAESQEVAAFLKKAGYKDVLKGDKVNYDAMRKVISKLGFNCEDHGGFFHGNKYEERSTGRTLKQKDFMRFLHEKFPKVK